MQNKIWTVYSPDGGPSTVDHTSRQSAINEAERLASLHEGSTFHVMESIGFSMVQKKNAFKFHNEDTPF